MNNYEIREINYDDYNNGYLELLCEFTKTIYCNSKDDFISYLDKMKNEITIIVIYSNDENKIIGCGTIFKINKLHYKPVGLIEDIVIMDKFRKYGFGKIIVNNLIGIGFKKYNCYKVILNCLDKNIEFYKK